MGRLRAPSSPRAHGPIGWRSCAARQSPERPSSPSASTAAGGRGGRASVCGPVSLRRSAPPRDRIHRLIPIPTTRGPNHRGNRSATSLRGSLVEPGELPKTMAAWVIREERFGEPKDAFQLEEIEVPEPGRVRGDRAGDGRGHELHTSGPRSAGPCRDALRRPSEFGHPSAVRTPRDRVEGRSRVTRWKPGDEVVVHCNRPPTRIPRSTASTRWPHPRRRSGLRDDLGLVRPVHQGPGPAAAAQAEGAELGGGGLLRPRLLHRLSHADDPLHMQAGANVLIWARPAGSACSPPNSAPPRRQLRGIVSSRRRQSWSSASAPSTTSTAPSSLR